MVVVARTLRLASPFRWQLLGIVALGLLSVPLALATPWPMQMAVDVVLGDQPPPALFAALLPGDPGGSGTLLVCALLVLLLATATHVVGLTGAVCRTSVAGRLTLVLRNRLLPHVQRLALRFHDSRGTADSTYRVLYDTEAVPGALIDGLVPLVTAALTLVGMILVTALLSWRMMLLAVVVAPLLALVSVPFLRRLRAEWGRGKELEAEAHTAVQETLGALRVVVAFGREDRERRRLLGIAERGRCTQVRISAVKGSFDLVVGVVVAGCLSAALWVGVGEVQGGTMTLGQLLVAMSYLTLLYGPMQTVLTKIGDVQASLVSAERVFALLDEPAAVVERPGARSLQRAQGEVVFEGVSFAYREDRPVFQDVSLSVEAGTCIGVVGATGAGKTTLLQLLVRLYDPTAGSIYIDGIDLRDVRIADLRDQFAVVPQEAVLFNASIRDNIAYGQPGAGSAEILRALREAGLEDFVNHLPEGIDTMVGERGLQVSGGERQRIALARAFLIDAAILVLDEPTSSLDSSTEASILEALGRLIRGRTTFLVSHRARVLELCDVCVRLEGGRMVGLPGRAPQGALA